MNKEIDLSNSVTLGSALTYYSQNFTFEDSKRWALDWIKKNIPDEYHRLTKIKDVRFSNRGFVCRLIDRGMKITDEQKLQLIQFFKEIPSEVIQQKSESEPESKEKNTNKLKKNNEIIFQLEDVIDDILSDKEPKVVDYKASKEELKEAMIWIEKEIINAQEQIAKQTAILAQLTTAFEQCGGTKIPKFKKKEKAPNSFKELSNIVKRVTYLKNDTEFNITSLAPSAVVGSKEVLVYNREKRVAYYFVAEFGSTLTFSGSSIRNADLGKSCSKIIRKPDLFFASKNYWEAFNVITTKAQKATTHVSDSCLFLVVK